MQHAAAASTPHVPDDEMSPQQAAAIKNNEKVFPVFAKKLSSNDKELFCSAIGKLSTWLSSEKAYYAEARPKIVGLLETAQATVRRQKGGDQNEPIHPATYPPHLLQWVNAYAGLIRTVVRFSGMFFETELHNRLQLICQMGNINPPSTSLPQLPPTQHIVPTQLAIVPSNHQRAPEQNENKSTGTPSAGPSTTMRRTPHPDERTTPAQNTSRPTSRPPSATTMHPSSPSLASALNDESSTFSPDPPSLPSKSPMGPAPIVPTSVAISQVGPPSSAVLTQVGNTTVAGAHHQAPIALDSSMAFVGGPSQAAPVPSHVLIHSSTALPTPISANISSPAILPTVPTPAQVLGVFSRPQLSPIRIPARPQPHNYPVQLTSTPPSVAAPMAMPIPIPAISTRPPQTIPTSSFSPIPTSSSASASTSSTPVPATAKKKKLAISEDLALADLEWFKAKQRKNDSKAASKAVIVSPASAVSTAGTEVKEASVPVLEDRALSDSAWLKLKRKKDFEAVYMTPAGGKGEGSAAISSATVEPRQVADHPSGAGPETTFESGSNSVEKVQRASERPVGQTIDVVSSSSITNDPSSVMMSDSNPDTVGLSDRSETSHRQLDDVDPMDVDQPQPETASGVTASSQTVKQLFGDVASAAPVHPAYAKSTITENTGMSPISTAISNSGLATEDGTVTEQPMVTSTVLDSAQTTHLACGNAATADDRTEDRAITDHEILPTVDDEKKTRAKQGGLREHILAEHQDPIVASVRGIEASNDVLPVASESINYMVAEGIRQDNGSGLDTERNESSVAAGGDTIFLTVAEKSETPHRTPMSVMPPSSDKIALTPESTNLQPALTENEVNDISPSPIIIPESAACLPSPNNASSINISTSMDISPQPDLDLNGGAPITRKRPRSRSLHADSDRARRLDASHVPLDTVTDETISHPVKQEGISETEVVQFLNTVPLSSRASRDVNGLPQTITAPTREPRKVDFGPEMVVIAAGRGSSSGNTMTIKFDIDDAQMLLISQWQSWNKTPDDVSQSMCLTLACYHWADLLPEIRKANGFLSLEKLVPATRCSWPTEGGLTMVVQRDEEDLYLPLSPPFHESPENLVDVSRLIRLRENTIRILQRSDMSGFVFVLHAHFPTRQQLEVVSRRRRKDLQWRDHLKHWTRQLDAPLPVAWSNACSLSK